MWWNELVRDYLHFSYRDRIAAVVLLLLITFVFCLPYLIPRKKKDPSKLIASVNWVRSGDSKQPDSNKIFYRHPSAKATLFYFDPNQISMEQWIQLGVRGRTAQTITRYRNKGGVFRNATDLQKIYGLRQEEFERLAPYVRIAGNPVVVRSYTDSNYKPPKLPIMEEYRRPSPIRTKSIDINLSDTGDWISLRGIGSKLANRIVNFRDRLGGFYSVEQVAETFGLKDSTFQLIRPLLKLSPVAVQKININTAMPEELKQHPYIRWQLANAIVNFRNDHGAFKTLDDLKQIMAITDELFKKIEPYLKLE